MDVVTNSFFEQFKKQYGYEDYADNDAFELFCIYCVASKYIKTDTIDKSILEDCHVGNGADWGIDGFIVIVNGGVVTTCQEVDDLLERNRSLQMKIVLVQSKTSEKFDVSELGNTIDGAEFILKFVCEENCLPARNEELTEHLNLVKHVYSKSADFLDGENPILDIYYITCGEYVKHVDFDAKIKKGKENISRHGYTSSFNCTLLGRKEIAAYYKETKSKIKADIKVEQKLTLPEIENIEEGYLCLLPFKEFKKLIVDKDSNIMDSVFYENVRAFQGLNYVNKAITETLKNGDINLFVAMNNGITVIAKKIRTTGANLCISDYQIVNGCQTSNVLQRNQNIQGIDNLMLTVKIIASNDDDIRSKIIIGNNSQTEVKREQFLSLSQSQKYIEDFYNAQKKYEKLFYERRSKQYNDDKQVPAYKIITIPCQIKAFVSMVMGQPDKVGGYYGKIVEDFEKNGKSVFAPDTNPFLYYTSALACHKMSECFDKKIIPREYKKVKFHVLLAFRLVCMGNHQPQFNSHKVNDYCDSICKILCDDTQCRSKFKEAIKLVNMALHRKPIDKDRIDASLTKNLIKLVAHNNGSYHYRKQL